MAGPRTNIQDVLSRLNQASTSPATTTDSGGSVPAPKFTLSRLASTSTHKSTPITQPIKRGIPFTSSAVNGFHTPTNDPRPPPPPHMQPNSSSSNESVQAGPSKLGPSTLKRSASMYDNMSIEKIQILIRKNYEEMGQLHEQLALIQSGHDEDNDPELIDEKLQLLVARNAKLKATISGRGDHSPSITHSPTLSNPLAAYPTPPTINPKAFAARLTNAEENPQKSWSSDGPPTPSRAATSYTQSCPPHQYKAPPVYEDVPTDVEMAEDTLIPPSSPPKLMQSESSTSRRPPPRAVIPTTSTIAGDDPFGDEFDDIPPEMMEVQPDPSPSRRIRAERSARRAVAPRSSQPRAGPSCSQPVVIAPKPVKVDIKHQWDKEVMGKLKNYFKLPSFRDKQKEAIDATMSGKDVFVLMPTGGGKSLTYQLPAVCNTGKTRGVTFVVSPLISLINDQTRHLCKLSIPAIAYTGELSQKDKNAAHELLNMPEPWTKIVYVTPEMLVMGGVIKGILRGLLKRKRLARFVVDEAHCVSQWGHDFRSDYLKLGELRKEYPGVPIMALTATAQDKVQEDIITSLRIKGCYTITTSFNRRNLHYEVRPKVKPMENMVAFIATQGPNSSGIIYCSSRVSCENLAKELRDDHGLKAQHYHAGMSKGDRRLAQEGWQEQDFEIIVATVAFGMGIDKPDVRYVIHHSLPRSLEGYYQETGRAGRDGKPSHCLLYYTFGDYQKVTRLIDMDTDSNASQKQRAKDSLDEVLAFCENKSDCRRTQVLAFFGETFDRVNCHNGCDTCLAHDKTTWRKEDVTEAAKEVVQLIQALDKRDRITIKNAAECYRGFGGNTGKGWGDNPMYGVGKAWNRNDAERLIQTLLIHKALDTYLVANNAGWSNSYLKLGKNANAFLRGSKPLTMEFRQKSPRKARTNRREVDQHAVTTFISNPIARQRSLRQIAEEEQEFDNSAWGDTDDDYTPSEAGAAGMDPIEVSETDDDVPLAKKKRKVTASTGIVTSTSTAKVSRPRSKLQGRGDTSSVRSASIVVIDGPGKSTTKRAPAKTKTPAKKVLMRSITEVLSPEKYDLELDRAGNGTPHEQCLRDLKKMRPELLNQGKMAPAIEGGILEFVAATLPTTMDSLKLVDGLTSAHRKAYADTILAICKAYARRMAIAQPPRPLKQTIQNIQSYAFTAAPDSSKTSGSSGSGPAFASSGVKPGGTGGVVSIVKPGSTARARF